MNFQEKVKEFQAVSNQPIGLSVISDEQWKFRKSLLDEEIRELKQAIADNNKVEILDSLCDIKYVNDGTANMCGEILEPIDDCRSYFTMDYFELLDSLDSSHVMDIFKINVLNVLLVQALDFNIDNFKTALLRVHESNMSKFCKTEEEAHETVKSYFDKGIETYFKLVNDYYVVYRSEDNKVLKSINYTPVDLTDLV